jgi:phospholipid/cholesterol/gamma-HCH transport system substrate-binding protein
VTPSSRQLAKLGIFALTVAAVLFVALLVVGGIRMWKPVDRYHVVTADEVLGVDVDSIVTLRGVPVGRVTSIDLDRSDFGRVQIELAIDPDIQLPAGSKAYLRAEGVTGQRLIDISDGTLADGRLAPGSEIPRGQTELEKLETRSDELLDQADKLLEDSRAAVADIRSVVDAVDPKWVKDVTRSADPEQIAQIVKHTERATREADQTAREIKRAVAHGRSRGKTLASDLHTAVTKAAEVLDRADEATKQLESTLEETKHVIAENRADVRATTHNLRGAAEDAKAAAAEIRDEPSSLLRRRRRRRRRRH